VPNKDTSSSAPKAPIQKTGPKPAARREPHETVALGKDLTVAGGFALWRKAMRWQRAVDASLGPIGLTHTQYLVLATARRLVDAAKDAVRQRAIAEAAGLDEATTSNVARSLTARGLLDRGPTVGDKRAWRVLPTQNGRRLLRQGEARLEAAVKALKSE
jgi:DNA-binding MarR family transcriptional regulator